MRCFSSFLAVLTAIANLADATFADDADGQKVQPIAVVKLDRSNPVSYAKDIEPIFIKKCRVCHSPPVTEAKFNLRTYQSLRKGGKHGTVIVPGKSAESLLVKLVGRTDAKAFMPPEDEEPLSPSELALIKLWIDQGAKPPAAGKHNRIKLQPLSAAVRLVRALAVTADKSIVAAGRANQIHVYDISTGEFTRSLLDPELKSSAGKPTKAAHLGIVESLVASPDNTTLASGNFGEVAVWNVKTGALLRKLTGFDDRVVALAFSPDGKYLAAGGGAPTIEGELRLYDVESGKLMIDLTGRHSDSVFGACFSPDGSMLASCGADQSIKIFKLPGGELVKMLAGHTHHVLDIGWRGDGKILASAGADKRVRLWDFRTGEQLTRINRGGGAIATVFLEHKQQVNRLLMVGDTSQILTCSGNQPVQLWNLELQLYPGNYTKPYYRGRVARSFENRNDYLYAIGISPDASVIATGGEQGSVQLYNGSDGKLLHSLLPPGVAEPKTAGVK